MKKAVVFAVAALMAVSILGCGASRARQIQNMKANMNNLIAQGDQYLRRGAPNYAYNHYTTNIRLYMKYAPDLNVETARLYVERGKVLLGMKQIAKADVDFNEARKLYPGITINVSGSQAEVMLPAGQDPKPNPNPDPNPNPEPEPEPEPRPAPGSDKIKIAILDFKEPPDTAGKGYGSSFAMMMTDAVSKGKLFTVVERSILDKIMQERNLSQTDLLEKAQASGEDKKILPVKYLIFGSITVEGNAVSVTARLIDWETGLSPVSDYSKRIIGQGTSPSFYFDEIAKDLSRKLEDGFLKSRR